MKRYLSQGGATFKAQLCCFRELEIPADDSRVSTLFCQTPEAIKMMATRHNEIKASRLSQDSFDSLAAIQATYDDVCPDDLFIFEYSPDRSELMFIYAPFEGKGLGPNQSSL